jgi:hypothetical protein
MNALELLEKANLADKLGNYKLADSIYKRVLRIAGAEVGFVDVILKGLEKAGLAAGGEITAEVMARIFNEAFDKAVISGEKAELEALLKGVDAETAAKVMEAVEAKDATKISVEELTKISEQLVAKANSEEAILNRLLDVPPTKPTLVDKTKEGLKNVGNAIKQKIQAFMAKPNAKKILAGLGIVVAGTAVGGYIFTRANGEKISDEEVSNTIDKADKMYNDRMKAGQQQRQNEAAQKFVDENKDKYTSQRAFYNAALAAGDENFANDVIAIVKKDMSLDIEPTK